MALEELASLTFSKRAGGVAVNLYSPGEAEIRLSPSNSVKITQETTYPFDGKISLTLMPQKQAEFPLFVRVPDWASSADIFVNGKPVSDVRITPGEFVKLQRTWKPKDVVQISFPIELRVHKKHERIGTPQGGPDLYNVTWFAVTRGPLVYAASGLIGGKHRESTLGLPEEKLETRFTPSKAPQGCAGPAYELQSPDGERLLFLPYFEADTRTPGTWRLTWIQNGIGPEAFAE